MDGAERALEEVTLDLYYGLNCPQQFYVEVLTSGTAEYGLIWNRVIVDVLIS